MMTKVAKAYQNSGLTTTYGKLGALFVILASLALIVRVISPRNPVESEVLHSVNANGFSDKKVVKALTWNIAAINNNPFEYWITNDDPSYNKMMSDISKFIEQPNDKDVEVNKVFTDAMFEELEARMRGAGWTGVDETKAIWNKDFRGRKIISQFMKDGVLGKKRLASMPDRVTNTINTLNEGTVTRPTVINCYSGDLSTMDNWWSQWQTFIFTKTITVKKKGVEQSVVIRDMLTPIKRSKYPALSEEEEKISIPLQTLSCAIFDAILVHMMNEIAKPTWQNLRSDMCNKLNHHKLDRTIEILESPYYNTNDIQFLQEVAGSFSDAVKSKQLNTLYDVYSPTEMDGDRDQNSYILLKKGRFINVNEVTSDIMSQIASVNGSKSSVPVMKGDLLALTVTDNRDGQKYLLSSFHGDTNGLATIPIVTAVHDFAIKHLPKHKLLFGLDANTYRVAESDQQGVTAFAEFYRGKKLNSCYGQFPNPNNFTTFHARTHLQPQLNKAVSLEEKDVKGDKNPKDFILFFDSDFAVVSTTKDNTGKKVYVENMVFPTLSFPSDHGITSTVLVEKNEIPDVSASSNNLRAA